MTNHFIWFLLAMCLDFKLVFPLSSSKECLPGNFSCAGDLRMTYKDRNVSLKATMMSLGSDLDVLKALEACSPRNTSCHGRTCSVLERRTKHSCYCDDICVDSGDCCFDYYDTCGNSRGNREHSKLQLVCHEKLGALLVSTCPPEVGNSHAIEACQYPNSSDLLQHLPVYDERSGLTYKNIFCAHCNNVLNSTFWKFIAKCYKKNTILATTRAPLGTLKPFPTRPSKSFKTQLPTGRETDQFSTRLPKLLSTIPLQTQSSNQRQTAPFATLPPAPRPARQRTGLFSAQPRSRGSSGPFTNQLPNQKRPIPFSTVPPFQRQSAPLSTKPPFRQQTGSFSIQSTTNQLKSLQSTKQPNHRLQIFNRRSSQTQHSEMQTTLSATHPSTERLLVTYQQRLTRSNSVSNKQNGNNVFDMNYIKKECTLSFEPLNHFTVNHCIPQKITCHEDASQLLKDLCSFYHLPLYASNMTLDNPHCALCQQQGLQRLKCFKESPPGVVIKKPSLTIMFDFSSKIAHSVSKDGTNFQTVMHSKTCKKGQVFDPFTASCRQVAPQTAFKSPSNMFFGFCKGRIPIRMNNSEFVEFSNSTVFVYSHNKTYAKELYERDTEGIRLCINFTSNYLVASINPQQQKRQKELGNKILSELTFFGCCLSEVSLLILIFTYGIFSELRNLPGKILISLACAMAIYQGVFFASVETGNRRRCVAIAGTLHYFLLVSFTWMNVLAFDVARVFSSEGGRASRVERSNMFFKYSVYAWGAPFVVVSTSLTLDVTGAVIIHYGVGRYCWIGNGTAAVVIFGVPVALILIFNVIALARTVLAIRKTREVTRRVTNRSNNTRQPLLYLKLTSVMGIPWILGFMAASEESAFLQYPFVVLNSLQGFFISLSFLMNKRVMDLYRARVGDIINSACNTGREKSPSVLVLTSATQDTKL